MAGSLIRPANARATAKPRLSPGEAVARLLLVIGSALLGFLAIETALGMLPEGRERVLARSDRRVTVGLDCYPTNPRGYFDIDLRKAAARDRFEALRVRRVDDCVSRAPYAVELRYNSLQFRDREPPPRRPGVRRVIVFGDSFTEGQGVKEADIYPRVLERTLNAGSDGGWEVLNFGRRGADFPALRDTFAELLAFAPDVVVYAMTLNDCEQSPAFRARDPLLSDRLTGRPGPRSVPSEQLFGRRTASLVGQRLERLQIDWGTTRWYHDLYGEPNREGWALTQQALREMHQRMRERGGQVLLATWPLLADLEGEYRFQEVHETVGRFCHGAGIAWVDLLPALKGRSNAALWVHPLDAHPNEVAHRLVATELAPRVRDLVEDGS